jgi:hypothetical protein
MQVQQRLRFQWNNPPVANETTASISSTAGATAISAFIGNRYRWNNQLYRLTYQPMGH